MADLNEYRVCIQSWFEPEKNAAESFVIWKMTLGSTVFVQVLRRALSGRQFLAKNKSLSTPLLLPRFNSEWLISFPQIKMRLIGNIFNYIATTEAKSCDCLINPLNIELNPICHLLALLGAHHIFHVSRIRVNIGQCTLHVLLRSMTWSFISLCEVPGRLVGRITLLTRQCCFE
jgi:hypothetical protein